MKTILIVLTLCVIIFTLMNLLFLLGIWPSGKTSSVCEIEDETQQEPPRKSLKSSLVFALNTYNINHNADGIAQEVLDENPTEDDLEQLIKHALKKIRQYRWQTN